MGKFPLTDPILIVGFGSDGFSGLQLGSTERAIPNRKVKPACPLVSFYRSNRQVEHAIIFNEEKAPLGGCQRILQIAATIAESHCLVLLTLVSARLRLRDLLQLRIELV
jgi:hypothetical protein